MTDAWDGRPENPERDGWHWLQDANGDLWCWRWYPSHQWFWAGNRTVRPREATTEYRYLGPCITPDEVAAREAAAAEAMREACEARIRTYPIDCEMRPYTAMEVVNRDIALADEIAALPLPAADALARALDQARKEEREACAQEVDCGCAARADVLARLATDGEKRASYLCVHGDVCCALQAAAIRARGKAVGGE